MKAFLLVVLLGLSLSPRTSEGQESLPPFFKAVIGDWSGEGELRNADGEVIPFTEEWTGKSEEDGIFAIRGTRTLGTETQEFRWVYHWNASLELYECDYWHTGMNEALRMEVSLSDAKAEMRSPFGDPGSELLVSNTLEGETLQGVVALTSAAGDSLLVGEAVHKRR